MSQQQNPKGELRKHAHMHVQASICVCIHMCTHKQGYAHFILNCYFTRAFLGPIVGLNLFLHEVIKNALPFTVAIAN